MGGFEVDEGGIQAEGERGVAGGPVGGKGGSRGRVAGGKGKLFSVARGNRAGRGGG